MENVSASKRKLKKYKRMLDIALDKRAKALAEKNKIDQEFLDDLAESDTLEAGVPDLQDPQIKKTNQKKSNLYVFTKIKDLAKYILIVTEKSPKKFRFTLVIRLQNYILDVIEYIYIANKLPRGEKRRRYQDNAIIKLSMLDYYAGICYEVKCIALKHYTQIGLGVSQSVAYLKKWIASDEKKTVSST